MSAALRKAWLESSKAWLPSMQQTGGSEPKQVFTICLCAYSSQSGSGRSPGDSQPLLDALGAEAVHASRHKPAVLDYACRHPNIWLTYISSYNKGSSIIGYKFSAGGCTL